MIPKNNAEVMEQSCGCLNGNSVCGAVYPDGSYTVNTWVLDCWTPAGMLCENLSDTITISGSLWDDWHIAPMS